MRDRAKLFPTDTRMGGRVSGVGGRTVCAGFQTLQRGKAQEPCPSDASAAASSWVMGRSRAVPGAGSAAGKPGGSIVAACSPYLSGQEESLCVCHSVRLPPARGIIYILGCGRSVSASLSQIIVYRGKKGDLQPEDKVMGPMGWE